MKPGAQDGNVTQPLTTKGVVVVWWWLVHCNVATKVVIFSLE
jgi:hypothetical protein